MKSKEQQSLKIAFLGNMNNNNFATARYLRDRGLDVSLLLFEGEQDHFHPSADAYDLNYAQWTRQLAWGGARAFLGTSAKQVRNDLADYDVLIGTGLSPAYCEKAGLRLDIFIPYGDDIWSEVSFRFGNPLWMLRSWPAAFYQRRGIGRSRVFHMTAASSIYERQYSRLRGDTERWIEGVPMVYLPPDGAPPWETSVSRTHWGHEFQRLREDNDVMVFYHGRHRWTCSMSDPNHKGTDKLLRGWSIFREQHPGRKAVLVTLEYGADVRHSKSLISELGISDSVAWLPKMMRKDLMVGLSMADIVCGEFTLSWVISGVLMEGLAARKPILAWRDDEECRRYYNSMYPIIHARDAQSIAAALTAFHENSDKYRRIGEEGGRWYREQLVETSVEKYCNFIGQRAEALGKKGCR